MLQDDLTYEEWPPDIFDSMEGMLRNNIVPLVKVHCQHYGVEECTWEQELDIKEKYSHLFGVLWISPMKFV